MSVSTVEIMLDWVELNIENRPALERMAAYVGYSEFYCSVKFREYVGVPFQEYIRRRKLSLAAAKLLDSEERILDIALQYGFSSHEAFTRAFKKAYGYSPCQYRIMRPDIAIFQKAQLG